MEKLKKGFAIMSPEKRKEIASKGGKAVSAIPGHMSKIGMVGGAKVSADRDHMSKIGSNGGKVSNKTKR